MTQSPFAHPTLYGLNDDGVLALWGQSCQACRHVMFPRQPYGCESCGAYGDRLEPNELRPEGRLAAFAQVHRHHGRDIDAPFVMAEIRLSSGPFFRCTLVQRDSQGLQVGDRLEGVLVPGVGPDAEAQELRFRKLES